MSQTVADIKHRLLKVSAEEFAVLERSLCADTRKGVQQALEQTRHRLAAQQAEQQRVEALYTFERELANGSLVVGLDEVGRGPLAGPLTVGAVVLQPDAEIIEGLNDSKQVSESHRPALAQVVKERALAWSIVNIPPEDIDKQGITACLRSAARCASIAAASLIAKVSRDALMVAYDDQYPGYDFASSKGYGSARHRAAIQEHGLTPIHRVSFCQNFL